MDKIKGIFTKIKSWSLQRKILSVILIIIIIFISIKILGPKDNSTNIVSGTVQRVNLTQTVVATGQVTSKTDLNLSFNSTGPVSVMNVSVGDKVWKGQVLATLNQGKELAALTKAQGAVAAARAKYDKVLNAYSNEEITLAKVLLAKSK